LDVDDRAGQIRRDEDGSAIAEGVLQQRRLARGSAVGIECVGQHRRAAGFDRDAAEIMQGAIEVREHRVVRLLRGEISFAQRAHAAAPVLERAVKSRNAESVLHPAQTADAQPCAAGLDPISQFRSQRFREIGFADGDEDFEFRKCGLDLVSRELRMEHAGVGEDFEDVLRIADRPRAVLARFAENANTQRNNDVGHRSAIPSRLS
jgi:hypothetical protein